MHFTELEGYLALSVTPDNNLRESSFVFKEASSSSLQDKSLSLEAISAITKLFEENKGVVTSSTTGVTQEGRSASLHEEGSETQVVMNLAKVRSLL